MPKNAKIYAKIMAVSTLHGIDALPLPIALLQL